MVTFRIDREDSFGYDFRDYVGIDDSFVIIPTRYNTGHDDVDWYQEAKGILESLDADVFPGECFSYYKELSHQQRKAILKIYEGCRSADDSEIIADVLNILYPERNFKTTGVYGCSQSDYAEIIYDSNLMHKTDIEELQSWYFGMVSEVNCEDSEGEDYFSFITDDKLWEWENNGILKEELLKFFGYPKETECKIYVSDGYTSIQKWKEVA